MVDLTNKEDEVRGVFPEITTREGAISYIGELIAQVETARHVTSDLEQKITILAMSPLQSVIMTAEEKRDLARAREKARDNLMMRYGRVVGALATLMHVRRIPVEDYNRLVARAHSALFARTIEVIGG